MTAAEKVAMSAKEAAEAYGLSVDYIYGLIKGNVIAAKRAGTKYLIPVDEFEQWFESLPDA